MNNKHEIIYLEIMQIASKFKKEMLLGEMKEAVKVCPKCKNDLHGHMAGPKKHFHMECNGCDLVFME